MNKQTKPQTMVVIELVRAPSTLPVVLTKTFKRAKIVGGQVIEKIKRVIR